MFHFLSRNDWALSVGVRGEAVIHETSIPTRQACINRFNTLESELTGKGKTITFATGFGPNEVELPLKTTHTT